MGAGRAPGGAATLLDKLRYLTQGAARGVRGRCHDVEANFYAEATRELNRRHIQVALDTEGQLLALGVEASRTQTPNQAEGEAPVARSSTTTRISLASIASPTWVHATC